MLVQLAAPLIHRDCLQLPLPTAHPERHWCKSCCTRTTTVISSLPVCCSAETASWLTRLMCCRRAQQLPELRSLLVALQAAAAGTPGLAALAAAGSQQVSQLCRAALDSADASNTVSLVSDRAPGCSVLPMHLPEHAAELAELSQLQL